VAELLESGEIFHPLGLNPSEAYTFLNEAVIYEESGILCRIPNWWRKKSESLKVSINMGSKAPSLVGFDALVDFDVQLSLGGESISVEEVQRLLNESEGLAFIKGKWVEVDRERLRDTLASFERASQLAAKGSLTIMEAMRMSLNASKLLKSNEKSCTVEVSHGQWLQTLLEQLRRPENIAAVDPGRDFHAVLRDYQEKGLNWLYTMQKLQLGACLADDMGLGKTIQVIALLNHLRSTREEKALLVIPASLIGNWTAEITRFAPGLNYQVIHPQESPVCQNLMICGPASTLPPMEC
jgi:non-specific serine/threonine protein kinase